MAEQTLGLWRSCPWDSDCSRRWKEPCGSNCVAVRWNLSPTGQPWPIGVGLWLPLLLQPARVDPTVVQGSIDYGLTLLLSGEMAGSVRYLYAGLISVPLLLLPSGRLRAFGLALVASGLIADWAYHHVFLSVWCYLSALLSLLVVGLVWSEPADSRRPSS